MDNTRGHGDYPGAFNSSTTARFNRLVFQSSSTQDPSRRSSETTHGYSFLPPQPFPPEAEPALSPTLNGTATRPNDSDSNDSEPSPRERFIHHLGWTHDPFETAVAEREYARVELSGAALEPPAERDTPAGRELIGMGGSGRLSTGKLRAMLGRGRRSSAEQLPAGAAEACPGLSRVSPSFRPTAYYVDPTPSRERQEPTFRALRKAAPAVVFGAVGAGKTTLRLEVETNARLWPDGTLIVTYRPSKWFGPERPAGDVSYDEHRRAIVTELANDLFIQIIEQFRAAAPPPSDEQNSRLCHLIRLSDDGALQAVLHSIIADEEPQAPWGYAALWSLLGRAPVRPADPTAAMRRWLESLAAQHRPTYRDETWPPERLWDYALETVRLWQFKRVFIQVDGVDEFADTDEEILPLLRNLLSHLVDLAEEDVFLKLYLPDTLERAMRQPGVTPWAAVEVVRLLWSPHRLRALLIARFRAVGSYRVGLSDLAAPELAEELDEEIITAADGSPRRLIEVVGALLTTFSRRQTGDDFDQPITADDWAAVRDRAAAVAAI